jgi:hypothetical protein
LREIRSTGRAIWSRLPAPLYQQLSDERQVQIVTAGRNMARSSLGRSAFRRVGMMQSPELPAIEDEFY